MKLDYYSKGKIFLVLMILFFCFFVLTNQVFAEDPIKYQEGVVSDFAKSAGVEVNTTNVPLTELITDFLINLMPIVSILFVGLILYAGSLYLFSQGSEDKVKKALQIIKVAIIGLLVVVMAYAITATVVYTFNQIGIFQQ